MTNCDVTTIADIGSDHRLVRMALRMNKKKKKKKIARLKTIRKVSISTYRTDLVGTVGTGRLPRGKMHTVLLDNIWFVAKKKEGEGGGGGLGLTIGSTGL